MELETAKQILTKTEAFESSQRQLAVLTVGRELERLRKENKNLKQTVKNQETLCKELVEKETSSKMSYGHFYQPETMKQYIKKLAEDSLLKEEDFYTLACEIAANSFDDKTVKGVLDNASILWVRNES